MYSPELPEGIESSILQFARARKMSPDEALLFLIESGLKNAPEDQSHASIRTPAEDAIGIFSSDADSVLMDEVVSLIYNERQESAQDLVV